METGHLGRKHDVEALIAAPVAGPNVYRNGVLVMRDVAMVDGQFVMAMEALTAKGKTDLGADTAHPISVPHWMGKVILLWNERPVHHRGQKTGGSAAGLGHGSSPKK